MVDTLDALGFTASDREILITLKVKLERMQEDSRDNMVRLARLEADRVTHADLDVILKEIHQRTESHGLGCSAHSKQLAQHEAELKTIRAILGTNDHDGLRGDVRMVLRYVWIGIGGLAVLQAALSLTHSK